MIKEWLDDDGRTVNYDNISAVIQYLDADRQIVEGPRQADENEVAKYRVLFPEATVEEVAAESSIVSSLTGALVYLRQVNEDSAVTQQELAGSLPVVATALYAYSAYNGKSEIADKLAVLVLAQSVRSVQLILVGAAQGISASISQGISIRADLDALVARVEALEQA
jgi:hypothetical protein